VRSSVWTRALLAPAVVVAVGLMATTSLPAGAAPAAAATASAGRVHPGANVVVAQVKCKAGLLLHQGKTVYVAIPASCAALPLQLGTVQDGCVAPSAPIGVPVRIAGAKHRAVLVYDSFTRMQGTGVHGSHKCHYNDLALVRLNPADARAASGAIPGVGGPNRVSRRAPSSGSAVTVGAFGGTAGATTHAGWTTDVVSPTSLVPADVGLPVVTDGQLVGMLTNVPSGTVMKTSAATYNLRRALTFLRKMKKFRHVTLLRAGQRP